MDDKWDELLTASADASSAPAVSSRLKSRLLSQLVRLEQAQGPLRILSDNKMLGDTLCVFEEIIAAMPSSDLQSRYPCNVCHARVVAERVEKAPIYWPGCPYARYCGH